MIDFVQWKSARYKTSFTYFEMSLAIADLNLNMEELNSKAILLIIKTCSNKIVVVCITDQVTMQMLSHKPKMVP